MEAISLLRIWQSNRSTATSREPTSEPPLEDDDDDDDDNDSYFELELTFPNHDNHHKTERNETDSDVNSSKRPSTTSSSSSSSCEDTAFYRSINRVDDDVDDSSPLRSEISKSSSPLSMILKSPTFRGLQMFLTRNDNSKSETSETESLFGFSSPKTRDVGFRIHDVLSLKRSNSNASKLFNGRDSDSDESYSPKRIAGDAGRCTVGKYLNLLSPSHYIKKSTRTNCKEEEDEEAEASIRAPASRSWMWSPINAAREKKERLRNRSRLGLQDRLGKSRSGIVGMSHSPTKFPAIRVDDSMEQQRKDGIEGAILHCKMSLNNCYSGVC